MFERRNLDLFGLNEHFLKENRSAYGIDWGTHKSLSPDNQIAENLPSEEITEYDSFTTWMPEDQPGLTYTRQPEKYRSPLTKRPTFVEQHQKVTIYLDKKLVQQIAQLKKDRYITSYSWLVSEAINLYLKVNESQ